MNYELRITNYEAEMQITNYELIFNFQFSIFNYYEVFIIR